MDLRPRINIDAEVELSELDDNAYKLIQKLAPFGKENPVPTFVSHNVEVTSCRTMGNDQQHLRMKLRQSKTNFDCVAFRLGERVTEVTDTVDIVYNLEMDRWNGNENLRLNIQSFRPNYPGKNN